MRFVRVEIDVVKIVEIVSIESSKNNQTTSNKPSWVSSTSWWWTASFYLSYFSSLGIYCKKIMKVIVSSSSKDINLAIVMMTGVTPSLWCFVTIEFDLLPFQMSHVFCFKKAGEIDLVQIIQARIFCFAACVNIDRIIDDTRSVKTAGWWLSAIGGYFYLFPRKGFHVVCPKIS